MKKMKKVFALLMTATMILSMSMFAFAAGTDGDGEGEGSGEGGSSQPAAETVTITVAQDSTYAGEAGGAGRTYNWYKVFDATYESNTSTGGGYDTDGTPGAVTGTATAASYEASAAVAAKLGSWVAATGTEGEDGYVAAHWEKASGNLWFKLTPISGSTKYVVEWDNSSTDTDTAQAAAKWLKDKNVYDTTGSLTWSSDDKEWSAEVTKGYYLIVSDTGANLVAATTDIDITEKNDYPPIGKTQADEDNTAQVDTEKNVAIGDVLTYQAKVTIPKAAKVGDTMVAVDTPSTGLTYNNDVIVKTNTGNATVEFGTAATGQAWTATITVTAGSQGKDVIFEYTMTVNAEALVDTGKINTFELDYGDNYTAVPVTVPFKTYFGGIVKTAENATGEPMEGVKFTLKEAGTEFKVTKAADGYYYPDATNGSSEVVTDADGLILIRGLDNDKTYTLTETETLPGFNMLDHDVTLVLQEDTVTEATTDSETGDTTEATSSFEEFENWGSVVNQSGSLLPSTGGIGTTIFYVAGAILVIGAGVVLITRRRMDS